MPQFEQIILRFTGNKMELKNQLKEWCESNDTSMNK